MILKVRDVKLSSGGVMVAILNKEDADELDVYALDRIRINNITAVVDISWGKGGIKKGQIGLFEEVLKRLRVKDKRFVRVKVEKKPDSVMYIKNKLDGLRLSENEINEIVKDAVDNKLSEAELSFFVSGCYANGLNLREVMWLSNAIANNGVKLNFKDAADKHSIGGVPGNRTTMIIVPILATAGVVIPKTSSRAITSAAGTADVMEVFCNVDFSAKKIKDIVKKTKGCIVWGGAKELASADDKLIRVERLLSLDPEGLLLASIMAKKKSVNAKNVLIDIPVGDGAKLKSRVQGRRLKKKFIRLGKLLGMNVRVMMSDGSQPVGNGIGPSLEARDVLDVLQGKGPSDLRKKSLYMAGLLLEMNGVKNGRKLAIEVLESGRAFKKFKQIIREQNGSLGNIKIGVYKHFVFSDKNGSVIKIDNKKISKLARVAGAPKDKGSGVYLKVKKNNKVEKGDCLFVVYAESKRKLEYAKSYIGGIITSE